TDARYSEVIRPGNANPTSLNLYGSAVTLRPDGGAFQRFGHCRRFRRRGDNGLGRAGFGRALAGAVGRDVGAGRAALGAEPAAAVGRGIEVDVAAALIGAHPAPGRTVLAHPHGQSPDGAGEEL